MPRRTKENLLTAPSPRALALESSAPRLSEVFGLLAPSVEFPQQKLHRGRGTARGMSNHNRFQAGFAVWVQFQGRDDTTPRASLESRCLLPAASHEALRAAGAAQGERPPSRAERSPPAGQLSVLHFATLPRAGPAALGMGSGVVLAPGSHLAMLVPRFGAPSASAFILHQQNWIEDMATRQNLLANLRRRRQAFKEGTEMGQGMPQKQRVKVEVGICSGTAPIVF